VTLAFGVLSGDALAQFCGGWSSIAPDNRARLGAAMATHEATQRVVLYGGVEADGNIVGLLRLHDGTAWTAPGESFNTPGRLGYARMAYDSTRTRVVMFGGLTPTGASDRTWAWTGSVWNDRTPGVGQANPTARYAHAMAYDPVRDRTLVHGGFGPNGSERNDFWSLNGQAWNQRVEGPTARAHHAMTFDPARGVAVLFGGEDLFPSSGTTVYFNDTWTWNGTAWTQRAPANSPSPRSGHTLAWDSSRQAVLLFGGFSPTNPSAPNETWEWNGSNWTLLNTVSTPSGFGRQRHAMASWPFPGSDRIIVMGGALTGMSAPTASTALWRTPVPPMIVSGPTPSSANVNVGANVTFTISASGVGLQYQWRKFNSAGGSDVIPGATGPTLTLTNVTESSSGTYFCLVTNACGSIQSADATLTVVCPPATLVQNTTPAFLPLQIPGATVTLSIVASGGQNLSYRWTRSGSLLNDGDLNGTTVSGSTTPTLTLSNLTSAALGSYRCVVTSNCPSSTGVTNSNSVRLRFIALPPVDVPVEPVFAEISSGVFAQVSGAASCDDDGCVPDPNLVIDQSASVGDSITYSPGGSFEISDSNTTDGGFKGADLDGTFGANMSGVFFEPGRVVVGQEFDASVTLDANVPIASALLDAWGGASTVVELGGLPSDRFLVDFNGKVASARVRPADFLDGVPTQETPDGFSPGLLQVSVGGGDSRNFTGNGQFPVTLSASDQGGGSFTITRNEDAGNWLPVNGGVVGEVRALATVDDALLVGGDFLVAGGQLVGHIARWNGKTWTPFGQGLDGPINSIIIFNGEIIAAGEFTRALGDDATPLLRIARWDGGAWRPMGAGFNERVFALEEHEGMLYAGGAFTQSGSVSCGRIAVWSDTNGWSSVGNFDGDVHALRSVPRDAFFPSAGRDLWAGGAFTNVDGQAVVRLASRIDGQWFGTYPVPGVVHAIEAQVVADETGFLVQRVVFGGDFVDASLGIRHVAAIENGDHIIPLNNGLNGPVRALYAHGEGRLSVLVAAGEFTETASQPASRLARLDGTASSTFSFEPSRQAWSPIKEGVNAPTLAIATYQGSLVVGGQFTVAGAQPASGLARFSAAAQLPECPGDTNGDNAVNFADLNAVLSTFGQTSDGAAGDVNGDGVVNFSDLNLVLSNFGVECQQ
jgi:hypothetical protein